MKLLPILAGLALVLAPSCAPSASPEAGARLDVRCELVGVEPTSAEQAMATFRVTNRGEADFAFRGYGPDAPLYVCEVLEGDTWQRSPIGWCGTGLSEQRLAPGGSLEFTTAVPRDGRSYRFELGQPAVWTPLVSSLP